MDYAPADVLRELGSSHGTQRCTSNYREGGDRRPASQVRTPPDAGRFLVATADDRLAALFHLMLFTGLRRGEALGLHWLHADIENLLLVVQWQVTDAGDGPKLVEPKTRAGRETSPSTEARPWRSSVDVPSRPVNDSLGVRAGRTTAWCSPTRTAASSDPTTRARRSPVSSAVPAFRASACMRHIHASLALVAGIDMKVVSDRLGQSTTAITADLYTYVIPAIARDAAERFAAAMVTSESPFPSAFPAQKGPSTTGTDPPEDVSAGQEGSRQGDLNP